MKKNFLLLLLLTVLPFAGWAANVNNVHSSLNPSAAGTFNGGDQALPAVQVTSGGSNVNTSYYTVVWKYNGSTVTVAHNAGTYTATITPTSGNTLNYSYGYSNTLTWTMNRANNNVSAPSFPAGNSWEYLQSPNDPSSTALDGTVTYQWYNGSSWTDWPVPASQKPGTYSVRALVAQTLNYNAAQSPQSTFVVTKAKVYVAPNNETAEWKDPWNGMSMEDITPTVTGAQNWSAAKSYLEWNQVKPVGDAEQAYEYTLQPNAAGTANEYYEYVVASSANVNIVKNTTGALSAGVDGADLTYNGEEQTLEPGAVPTFEDSDGNVAGTIEYSLNGTDWSTEYPKAKDAQVYTVQFRGIGDQNHEDETVGGSYDVEILPYELVAGTDFDAPTAKTDGVYTEDPALTPKPQDIAIAGTFKGKFAEELTTKGAKFIYPTSADLPQEANAGTYSFDWDIDVTTATNFSYTAGATTVNDAKIAKATLTTDPEADATALIAEQQYEAKDLKLLKGDVAKPEFMGVGRSGTFTYYIDSTPVTGTWEDVVGQDADEDDDANTYVLTYTFVPDNKNFADITDEQPIGNAKITKADLTVSGVAAKDNVVYSGSAQSILKHGADVKTSYGATLPASEYSVSYTGGETSPVNAYANVKQTNAGKYEVTCQVTPIDTKNFNTPAEFGPVEATIGLAPLNFGVNGVNTVWADGVTYTWDEICSQLIKSDNWLAGEDATAKALILSKGLSVTVNGASDPAAGDFKKMLDGDAGTYKVEFTKNTLDADKPEINYDIELWNWTVNVVIDKADIVAADFTAPVAADLYYTGEAQDLVATGYKMNKPYGEIQFATAEDGTYSTTIPQGTDADDYEVWFKIVGDDNHNDFAPVQVADTKIKQAANAITNLALEGWTYGEEANEPVADATFKAEGEPTFTYSDSETGTFTDEVPTNAGTWYVKASVEETTNWAAAEKTISFVIDKADATCEAPEANELIYNGDDQALVVEPTYNGGTIQYSLDGTTWSEDIPTGKDADTYEVYYKVVGDANHYDFIATEPVEVAIAPKALDIAFFVFSADEATYNFKDQKPTYELLSTEPIADTDYDEVSDAEMINVGEYTFTFTGKANYTGKVEFTFTINKKDQEVVAPKAINLTYNGKNQTLVEAGTTDADGLVYAIGDGEFGELDVLPEAKDAGTYTVKYAYVENDNFNAAEGGEVEVTIEKATIGYMLGGMTKVWDGKAITEEAEEAIAEQLEKVFTLYAGELFEGDKYDVPFTLALPEDYRDAGSYKFSAAQAQKGVQFKEGYPVNYKINFAGEGEVVIEKADIAASDFTAPTAIEGLKFTGKAQALVEGAAINTTYQYPTMDEPKDIASIVYFVGKTAPAEDSEEWSEKVPTGTDAGDYPVWYMVKGDDNHNNLVAEAALAGKIAAKVIDFAVKFESADETYDRSDFMPEDVVAYDGETALEADKDYTLTIKNAAGDDVTELINADTYTFTYAAVEGGNYEGSANVVRTITVAPRSLEDEKVAISKFESPKAYTGADQKPTLSISFDEIALTAEEVDVEAAEEMTNAGEYTFTFTGKGNFCDEITATFEITKLKAIAQLENATKVYDGVVGLGDTEVEITWGGLLKGEAAPEVGEGAIIVKDESANVGEYELGIVSENFVSDNYEVVPGNRAAIFSITPAPLMVNWDTEAEPFTKVYGEDDPVLSAEGKLSIAGAVEADVPAIVAQTVITRAEGEAVGKYAVTLSADEKADPSVFANYEVTFTGADKAFEIKKAALIVSLAPKTVEYSAQKAELKNLTSADLVVSGLIGDDDKDVVTSFDVVIPDDAIAVGEYQIEVANAVAADYEIEYLPATLTITAKKITATLKDQKVQQGKTLDETAFTAEGILEGDEDYFYVAAPGLADMDGIVTGEAGVYAEGLVLAVDDEVADNYTIEADPAELEIIAADAIVIADNADFVTEAKEGVDVTFTDRSINAGTWNVLALPFEATVKQISDAFGYAAVDILNEDGNTPGEVHFKVISSGTIPAYTPFIIKTTEDDGLAKDNFNQVVFHNVNIEACDGTNNAVEDAAENKFWGTFQAVTTFYGAQYWYMSKGAWKDASKYTASKPVSLKAFRAYVEFKDVPAEGARIFIEEPDGTITAINGLEFNKAMDAEGWFTVNGMKLNEAPAQKGTYIKDGKKVIVK